MVVAFVRALAAVGLGELDPVALDMVDGADMDSVGADHLHMLPDVVACRHRPSPSLHQRAAAGFSPAPATGRRGWSRSAPFRPWKNGASYAFPPLGGRCFAYLESRLWGTSLASRQREEGDEADRGRPGSRGADGGGGRRRGAAPGLEAAGHRLPAASRAEPDSQPLRQRG